MGWRERRVGPPDVPGERVPVSVDLIWFLVGVVVGTFAGIGLSVVVAWRVMRLVVSLAVAARENRMRGGPNSRRAV